MWCLVIPQGWSQNVVQDSAVAHSWDNTGMGLIWQNPLPVTLTGVAIVTGASPLVLEPMRRQNLIIREEVQMWRRNTFDHRPMHFDNFIQFAPISAVMLLDILGVPSRHSNWPLFRRSATTMIVTMAVTQSMKHTIYELRPDRSASNSFPSGHTAFAFSGAELLRLEYQETSVWIPVAGFALATLTGFMRIYNDRHWAGDVLAGAGIGLLTADFSYWLNDWMDRKVWKR